MRGLRQALANPFPHTFLIHPPFLVERNTEGLWNNKISWPLDAFRDDLGWKFCSIRSDSKCDSEAPFFCSVAFYRNRSASSKHVDESSKGIGVSSMLKILDKGYPAHCLAAMMKWWNCTIFSSMSSGIRWASVVFARKLTVSSFPVLPVLTSGAASIHSQQDL